MKRPRFTEAQIIGIPRGREASVRVAGPAPRARAEFADLLQSAGQVRRAGGVGGEALEGAAGR
jgi:hypothetical protein